MYITINHQEGTTLHLMIFFDRKKASKAQKIRIKTAKQGPQNTDYHPTR